MATSRGQTSWQPMTADDIAAVVAIADVVHPGFPEDSSVLAERLALHPSGCFVLRDQMDAAILGYLLSHPWESQTVPTLNKLIGRLPDAELYYIHDIALLLAGRGMQAGDRAVEMVEAEAKALGLKKLALVAVNNSAGFWQRHGFVAETDPKWTAKLASYGADAAYMMKTI